MYGEKLHGAEARIEHHFLSDRSAVCDVVYREGETELRFGCPDEDHAERLRDALNECAWIEVESFIKGGAQKANFGTAEKASSDTPLSSAEGRSND